MTRPMGMPTKAYIIKNSQPVTESGCWVWCGYLMNNGYGGVRSGKNITYAHRLSYKLFKGDIPSGLHILHQCDVRACVNPAHLRAGTNQDNIRDSMVKGRRKRAYKPRPYMVGKEWKLKPEICEGRRKIKTHMIPDIKKLISEGTPVNIIATKYNVSSSLIWKILKNGK